MQPRLQVLFSRKTLAAWALLGLAALLLSVFLKLTFDMFIEREHELTLLDETALHLASQFRTPRLTMAVMDLSAMGSTTVLTILCLSLFLLSWMRGDRSGAVHLSVGGLGAAAWTSLLKHSFERERPNVIDHLVEVGGYSYPSGHSLAAAAVYFTLALVMWRQQRTWSERVVVMGLATTVVLLIGLSRIYLGVHYPTDVLAGLCLGTAWAFLLAAAYPVLVTRLARQRETEP